jgi:hypothetical protein
MSVSLSRRQILLGAAALSVLPNMALAKDAIFTARRGRLPVGDRFAIRGYDPVAYFDGTATPGDDAITTEWNGVLWSFSSDANRTRFIADPEAFAPQYGGYCAWAVAQGYTAPIDPEAWKVVDNRLYLNANRSVQQRWEADIPGFIARANENWPAVLN